MKYSNTVRVLAAAGIALLTTTTTSCVAVAAAAVGGLGYLQYERNEATRDFPATLEATWDAAIVTLEEMGVSNATKTLDKTQGVIDGEDVWVRVEVHPTDFTRVRVRFGTFTTEDHRRRSRLFLDTVQKRLGVDAFPGGHSEEESEMELLHD